MAEWSTGRTFPRWPLPRQVRRPSQICRACARHRHQIQGPSRRRRQILGPSRHRRQIQGPSRHRRRRLGPSRHRRRSQIQGPSRRRRQILDPSRRRSPDGDLAADGAGRIKWGAARARVSRPGPVVKRGAGLDGPAGRHHAPGCSRTAAPLPSGQCRGRPRLTTVTVPAVLTLTFTGCEARLPPSTLRGSSPRRARAERLRR